MKKFLNFKTIFFSIIIVSIVISALFGIFFFLLEKSSTSNVYNTTKKDENQNIEQEKQKSVSDEEKNKEQIKPQTDSTSKLNQKIYVINFLEERGVYDDSYIYKTYENEKYYLFDTLVLSHILTFMVSKEDEKLSCIQSITGKEPFCGDLEKYSIPKRESIPPAKIYNTPQEVYEDFRKAIITENFVLFRQTIAGEAEENYGFSPTEDSYDSQYNGMFQMKEIVEEKFDFDYFKKDENFWLHGPNKEQVKFEGGLIFLKGGGKLLVMKLDNTWKIVED